MMIAVIHCMADRVNATSSLPEPTPLRILKSMSLSRQTSSGLFLGQSWWVLCASAAGIYNLFLFCWHEYRYGTLHISWDFPIARRDTKNTEGVGGICRKIIWAVS